MKITKSKLQQLVYKTYYTLISEQFKNRNINNKKNKDKSNNPSFGGKKLGSGSSNMIQTVDKGKDTLQVDNTCDSVSSFNSLFLFHNDCNNSVVEITEDFICCSTSNPQESGIVGSPTTLFTIPTVGFGNLNAGGDNDCLTIPADNLTNPGGAGNTFTAEQFDNWFQAESGNGFYLGFAGDPPVPDGWGLNTLQTLNCSQEGCNHPQATNYNSATPGDGCASSGTIDPFDYSCCEFTGCGAVGTSPPANNVGLDETGQPLFSGVQNGPNYHPGPDEEGSFLSVDEQMEYWVDSGTCQFDGCTSDVIILNNITYETINGPGLGDDETFLGVTHNEAYSYQGVTGADSPYLSTPINDNGGCIIQECTDTSINGLTDNLGNNITDTFQLAIDSDLVSGFILESDNSKCRVFACMTEGSQNYYDIWYTGNTEYLEACGSDDDLSPNDCCVEAEAPEIFGCTDSEACNYNANANNSAGCTYPEDSCQVCADQFGNVGQVTDGTGVVIFDPNCEGCTNLLDNAIPTNHNFNVTLDNDNGSCTFNYCWISTQQYQDSLEALGVTDFDQYTVENYGCGDETNYGSDDVPLYLWTLCTLVDGSSEPCSQACPNGFPMDSATANVNSGGPLGTFNDSMTYCENGFPGCMDEDACNYNPDAAVSDDSCLYPAANADCNNNCLEGFTFAVINNVGGCVPIVYGCTYPGFNNFDPLANVLGESADNLNNPCKFEGCMDNGSNYDEEPFISQWDTYVCKLGNTGGTAGDSQYLHEGINPLNGDPLTLSHGEWLCQCGNYPSILTTPPCAAAAPIIGNGIFMDTEGGNTIYSSDPNNPINNYTGQTGGLGSCSGGGIDGCNNLGVSTYVQNLEGLDCLENPATCVEVPVGPDWAFTNTDDGSCIFYGCTDPLALNYFCNDNPGSCAGGSINTAIADPSSGGGLYPADTFECVYQPSFNCGGMNLQTGTPYKGCNDPGDGSGEFATLAECESSCKKCTNVEAHECNVYGSFYEFECLTVDGDVGVQNVLNNLTDEGEYGIGKAFTIEGDDKIYRVDTIIPQGVTTTQPLIATTANCVETYLDQETDLDGGPTPVVLGCMNEGACNYDPDANTDDGSCFYDGDECELDGPYTYEYYVYYGMDPNYNGINIGIIEGCQCEVPGCIYSNPGPYPDIFGNCADGSQSNSNPPGLGYYAGGFCDGNGYYLLNFNPYATILGDGVFINGEEIGGCDFITNMDSDPTMYINGCEHYSESEVATLAGVDSDPFDCYKCMNSINVSYEAQNYPDFVEECMGCMNPAASNYDPTAVVDDGSCYIPIGTGNTGNTGNTGYTGGGTSYGGGACFTPNTLITMADGNEQTISSIKLGDKLKSEIGESNVIGIDIHIRENLIYSINNSEHFVTADHPFKTIEGWKSIDPVKTFKVHGINSEALKVGDIIIKIDGEEEITSIEGGETASKVYNLKLDNEHVYYANGYLVHNKEEEDMFRGPEDEDLSDNAPYPGGVGGGGLDENINKHKNN